MPPADLPSDAARPRELVPFRSLSDHRLAPGEPDIHGWPVVGAGGVPFGVVDELLVNPTTAEVVSLLVSPVSGAGVQGHAELPMARHRIDAERRRVLSDLDVGELAAYGAGARGRAAQSGLRQTMPTDTMPQGGGAADRTAGASPTAWPAAPADIAPARTASASSMALPVRTPLADLRLPGEPLAGMPGATVERTADGEEIIRVPVVEEELVIERRAVVKEVVVIRKRAVTENRVVEADLRRERVHVDGADLPPARSRDMR